MLAARKTRVQLECIKKRAGRGERRSVVMALDLTTIADGISSTPFGYWTSGDAAGVSYPQDGNENCFSVEDASFWFAHRNQVILAAVQTLPPPNEIFLDAGGGNGYVTKALQDSGFAAVLLEPNVSGAANAVRRGVRHVIRSSIGAAHLRGQSVGAIGLFDVIEHIDDDLAFLRALRKALVPGGRLYATVPALQSLWSADDASAGHFRRYSTAELERLLIGAGFGIDYCTYFFWCLPLPILFFRVLPSKLGLRGGDSISRIQAEHSTRSQAGRWFLSRILHPEPSLVRRRKSVPCGASCLVVATRPAKERGAAEEPRPVRSS